MPLVEFRLRVANLPESDFERVVFPGQRLMFEAAHEAELEIYSSDIVILNDLRESMIGTQIRQGKSSLLNEQLQEILATWERPTLLLEWW